MARLLRAAMAFLFCLAAIAVFSHMAAINNWGDVQIRAPIFTLALWVYAVKPASRLIVALSTIALTCIGGAALMIVLPFWPAGPHPLLLNALGAVGFTAAGTALAAQIWLILWRWRSDRKRLRTNSRGPLERLTGGF